MLCCIQRIVRHLKMIAKFSLSFKNFNKNHVQDHTSKYTMSSGLQHSLTMKKIHGKQYLDTGWLSRWSWIAKLHTYHGKELTEYDDYWSMASQLWYIIKRQQNIGQSRYILLQVKVEKDRSGLDKFITEASTYRRGWNWTYTFIHATE